MKKIHLFNVIDIRTGQYYSEVITRERNAKWFAPAEEPSDL